MLEYIGLPVAGFLIGLLVISFGGGGGAIYVGILTVFFNISPAIAASTSLATIVPTTAAGAFSHWKAGNINFHYGITMLVCGVIGSIVGSYCSKFLPLGVYSKLTGIIFILLGIQMFVSNKKRQKAKSSDGQQTGGENGRKNTVKAICFGTLAGAMSGLIGLSGGGAIVGGLAILGCSAMETVGTSVLVLLGISITGFSIHLGLGNIDWQLVGLLAIGTISGSLVGPFLLKRTYKGNKELVERIMQPAFLAVITVMGILMLLK